MNRIRGAVYWQRMTSPVVGNRQVALVAYDRALTGGRRYFVLGGAAVGCGFMIKSLVGLFGVIPLAILIVFGRRWKVLRDPWFWAGTAVALAIAVPWHAYQLIGNTDAFLEFTWRLHVEKQIFEAQPWSSGPPWFYLEALIVSAPVLGMCVLVISAARAARCSKEARSGPLCPYRGLGRPDTQNEALKPISGGGERDSPLADVLTGTAGLWQVALVLL